MAVATRVRDRAGIDRYEVALVARAQAGDVAAEDELDALYRPKFARFVRRWLKYPTWYDDLVQVAMARLFETLSQYNPKQSIFSSWAYRIAKCAMLNEVALRKMKDCILSLDLDFMEFVEDPNGPEDDYIINRVQEAVDGLEPEKRLSVNGPHKEGLTDAEVAVKLNIAERRVSYRRQQAYRDVRNVLCEVPFTSIRPKTRFCRYG